MRVRIEAIHESLVNGQGKQAVKQIDQYGLYDFWSDYRDYLETLYVNKGASYRYFSDAVIAYHHIKGR